jgi:hypothetical protein
MRAMGALKVDLQHRRIRTLQLSGNNICTLLTFIIMFAVTMCHSKEMWLKWIQLGKQKIDP